MAVARIVGLVVGLVALAAAGAVAATLLLSTIGGAPDEDPVGRLRPVAPGLDLRVGGGGGATETTPATDGSATDHDTDGTTEQTDGSATDHDTDGTTDGDHDRPDEPDDD